MAKKKDYSQYGPTVLRAVIGLFFIIPGINKLMNPAWITGMLDSMNFMMPTVSGWALIIIEIVFGAAVLFGYKLKYTVWPLVIVFIAALFTLYGPAMMTGPKELVGGLFQLVGIGVLVSLYFTGPGAMAVKQ